MNSHELSLKGQELKRISLRCTQDWQKSANFVIED
jgi:hypothetical protein